jgi:protein arginine N-methyltransferase 1
MYDTGLAQLFEYHGRMLRDRVRVDGFRAAISRVVRPGHRVLDLGSGSGILALFACQAGAEKVYAIERGRIAELARQLCIDNGYADRIQIINEDSRAVQLPERADVLVTETLWNFGLGEGLLAAVSDAQIRLLVAGAPVIPKSLQLCAAPVELPSFRQRFDVWNDGKLGVKLSGARSSVLGALYPVDAPADSLLASPAVIATVDLGLSGALLDNVGGDARYDVQRNATVHGILGWFHAELAPDVCLSNGPPNACPSWHQALLPLDPALAVAPGDALEVRIDAVADGSIWRWRVTQIREDAVLAERTHSTLRTFARFTNRNDPGSGSGARGEGSPPTRSR